MDFLKNAESFSNTYNSDSIVIFKGKITQEIVHSYTALVGQNMTNFGADEKEKRKVYHVLVELLQNICKHSYSPELEEERQDEEFQNQVGIGAVFFGFNDNQFGICTINKIESTNIPQLRDFLDHINSLDKDALKDLYKFMIKESKLSDKGGAGLGYVDIAKKNLNKFNYSFIQCDDVSHYFVIEYSVNKIAE